MEKKPVTIVDVWSHNLEYEFGRIAAAARYFPFISLDTEFPGVVYRSTTTTTTTTTTANNTANPKSSRSSSSDNYKILKSNVDSLHLIQLGMTLSDFYGNLPDFGGDCNFVWQFNFKEFDVSYDPHAPDSIELLKQQGIDFDKNMREGVDSTRFSQLMFKSGLIIYNTHLLQWVTFHGAYDFAYLLKVITGQPLPEDLGGFYSLLNLYFGQRVYDVKQMIKFCDGVFGGLERVASTYGLKRIAGNAHCAGSDSLLTFAVFQKLVSSSNGHVKGCGILFGLEIDSKPMPVMHRFKAGPPLHPCGFLSAPVVFVMGPVLH